MDGGVRIVVDGGEGSGREVEGGVRRGSEVEGGEGRE